MKMAATRTTIEELENELELMTKAAEWLADKLSEYEMDRIAPPDMDGDEWLLDAIEAAEEGN